MMTMYDSNDLLEALGSDAHLVNSIRNSWKDILIVQSDSNVKRMVCVHEPLLQNAEIYIGGNDLSSDNIVCEYFIADGNPKIGNLCHDWPKGTIWQMQAWPFFWSGDPSFQKHLSRFAHKVHDCHIFEFIHVEVICLERAQDEVQILESFKTSRHRGDNPTKVDVICIDDDWKGDPIQIIYGQKIMKNQIHA